jgi:phospholipid/cholesterol/gamma-HCH transport system substrate-binding protein
MEPRARPAYRTAGLVLLLSALVVLGLLYGEFRGTFTPHTVLTVRADRAGLVLDPGTKVTFNGVEIGRVSSVAAEEVNGSTKARLTLQVDPRYPAMIPANVIADITATTVFGNKYVSFRSPENPSAQHVSSSTSIVAANVSTEFNTLFQTIMSISEKVDPVKLNATLAATAEALTGQGSRFGTALKNGNAILDEINPRLPALGYDLRRLGDLAEVYRGAAPDLLAAFDHAVPTAATLHDQRGALDAALLASVGFAGTAADVFDRAAPFLVRGAADMLPTSAVFDENSPALLCTLRNYAEVGPRVASALGGNGSSLSSYGGGGVMGAEPPYVYPDNLPRVNATGGPGGRPGCWQPITLQLWPAPYLVMDTGASIAPYNHLELGQPLLTEYVWGRQIGENTINP